MSDRPLLIAWAVFAAVGSAFMFALPGAETIPFHLVWVSLAVVYGLRAWTSLETVIAVSLVVAVSGAALGRSALIGDIPWEETTEIPLMGVLFVVMMWHVKHRDAARAELARLVDQQRQLVRRRTHELRTSITVARGYSELTNAVNADADVREDLAVVMSELDRLNLIASQLLTIADSSEGVNRQHLAVDEFVRRLAQRWQPAADRVWTCTADRAMVRADEARLTTALDCFVENAVKFTQDGGRITLSARQVTDRVVFAVADSGGRPKPPGTRGGSGLGLQIARTIARAHGGDITLVMLPAGGAVASLWLPCEPTRIDTQATFDRTPHDVEPDSNDASMTVS